MGPSGLRGPRGPVDHKGYGSRGPVGPEEALWSECTNALFLASNPIPAKVLLLKLGRISSSTLKLPLTDKDLLDAKPLLHAHQTIQEWFRNQSID